MSVVTETSFLCDLRYRRYHGSFHYHARRRRPPCQRLRSSRLAFTDGAAYLDGYYELGDQAEVVQAFHIYWTSNPYERQLDSSVWRITSVKLPALRGRRSRTVSIVVM